MIRKFFALLLIFLKIYLILSEDVKELPYCSEKSESGAVFVSTLDGKLSALNASGGLMWQIDTGPGPLLISNIHKSELTNSGEWIRIIPSLSGTLYKFDGQTIDPIPISADSLLKSSFKYSDDLVIAGGLDVRTYGVSFESGKVLYECTPEKCTQEKTPQVEDVLVIKRQSQTVRAVEPRTGHERWNFSVGLHNIKLPTISCLEPPTRLFNWNISAVLPEGLLYASSNKPEGNEKWEYKFPAPIVYVWQWNGREMNEVNLFAPTHGAKYSPAIYIGMHKKQLYIHESTLMQNLLNGKNSHGLVVAESGSLTKIPWKPVPASKEAPEDESTALSVLNSSEYVNGNGYYLYTEQDLQKKEKFCNKTLGNILREEFIDYSSDFQYYINAIGLLFLPFIIIFVVRYLLRTYHPEIEKVCVSVSSNLSKTEIQERRDSEMEDPSNFNSRFSSEYEVVDCLGKGGFGIVFEVKQKIDECSYAIKRITLPKQKESRDRVMREVKALAKLDHHNIVRYFNSWLEQPPLGWKEEHDKNWIGETQSAYYDNSTSKATSLRSQSKGFVNIDMSNYGKPSEDDDSFILFKKDSQDEGSSGVDCTSSNGTVSTVSEHQQKINWRKPERRHHSWDLSQDTSIILPKPPVFLYIQMQLCKKESLKDWLMNNQNRNYEDSLKIFLQILDAVEYVHLRGLIHRDLKPGNIFFSLDGQVKIGDFGLVKDMEDSFEIESRSLGSSKRGHTEQVGTQLYMSPEQSKSSNYDYKVDIYSLGLILFELLVPCSTDSERIAKLTDLKSNKYPKDFTTSFPNEYDLLQNMVCEDPDKRLNTIGIKAREPFRLKNDTYGEEYHFKLPKK